MILLYICDIIKKNVENIIDIGGIQMSDFRKQINEDILEYQKRFPMMRNISKPEWAFNYWVLDKLFFEEEELIEEKIIDYHDMGIDAYEIYEDTKEVYLIQNKYYSDNSTISEDYLKNNFLLRGLTALEKGTYTRCDELQDFFKKYQEDEDFTVYLQLFVTNDVIVEKADNYVKKFNIDHPKYQAKIYYLKDIEERYYGEIKQEKTNLTEEIISVNKGTILNIDTVNYKINNVLNARYVLTPVVSLYRLYDKAIKKKYPIFDKNIREYLGNKGINKNIYKTLLDPNERKNFFYYNNGVTLICEKMHGIETKNVAVNMDATFKVDNPQIVNGCQTVNSIYEALKNINPSILEEEFKDTFVMLKVLEIKKEVFESEDLYKNIVRYNNSQNSINEKAFVANSAQFLRLQNEFEKKGFLLLVKQSDKNKFVTKYKSMSKIKALSFDRLDLFGLKEAETVKDLYIELDKLLQVINAFAVGGYDAYTKKSNMLKFGSEQYNTAVNFIKSVTIDVLLDLYLLYSRAEKAKLEKSDSRAPISYYLIDGFAKYECDERSPEKIRTELNSKEKINYIIKLYTGVTRMYMDRYFKKYNIDYNKMIKKPIEYDLLSENRDTVADMFLAVE